MPGVEVVDFSRTKFRPLTRESGGYQLSLVGTLFLTHLLVLSLTLNATLFLLSALSGV